MKPDTQLLRSVWSESREVFAREYIELGPLKLDQLISSIFSNGPFYFYIVDFTDQAIQYISPSVQEIHGLDPAQVTFQDILDQIHPEDMPFVAGAESAAIELFANELGLEKLRKYKISYCFRFRTTDGSYQLFNHQSIVLTTDKQNRVAKALNIHTNISHLTDINKYQLSLIGLPGEPSYLNIDVSQQHKLPQARDSLFTEREAEIIRLIADGRTSEDIARLLFIAANTVKNHRKNILRKTGCKNTSQLISKCVTEGWL